MDEDEELAFARALGFDLAALRADTMQVRVHAYVPLFVVCCRDLLRVDGGEAAVVEVHPSPFVWPFFRHTHSQPIPSPFHCPSPPFPTVPFAG